MYLQVSACLSSWHGNRDRPLIQLEQHNTDDSVLLKIGNSQMALIQMQVRISGCNCWINIFSVKEVYLYMIVLYVTVKTKDVCCFLISHVRRDPEHSHMRKHQNIICRCELYKTFPLLFNLLYWLWLISLAVCHNHWPSWVPNIIISQYKKNNALIKP